MVETKRARVPAKSVPAKSVSTDDGQSNGAVFEQVELDTVPMCRNGDLWQVLDCGRIAELVIGARKAVKIPRAVVGRGSTYQGKLRS